MGKTCDKHSGVCTSYIHNLIKKRSLERAKQRVIRAAKIWRGNWDKTDFVGCELLIVNAIDALLKLEKESNGR